MTRIAVPIARIAAVAVTTPVRISAATTVATFNVLTWELRQLARLPLWRDARRVHHQCHELAAKSRQAAAKPDRAAAKPGG